MKNILVTTDFSKNSESAIYYAISIAKLFSAKVEIFNSFVSVPAIGIDGGPGIMNETVIQAGMDHNADRLADLIAGLDTHLVKNMNISFEVGSGDPVLTICERAREIKCDMIVMGTKGESRIEELLFGSTTVDVMKEASCPVLAIPPDSKFYGIKKIVYASDLEENDVEVIKRVCRLASTFDSDVVVFHAFSEDNMTAQEDADVFNEMLQKNVNYRKLSKESITYGNTHDAILNVIKKDLANLIVMREKKRGIFSRLFHPDMVKRINYHTTIPLLTYNSHSLEG